MKEELIKLIADSYDRGVKDGFEVVLQLIKELRPAIKPMEGMGKGKTTDEWFDILVKDIGTQHMNKYEQIKGMANPNRGSVGAYEPWCMKMNDCKTKCEDCPDEPLQRSWVGLTRDEQSFVYSNLHNATSRIDSFWVDFANAIEAKLKERNT